MKLYFLLLTVLNFFVGQSYGQESVLAMHPALNPDGTQLSFSWQGDIWVYDYDTKNVTRLTVNESYDAHPVWDSNGERLAFISNRYGNSDIFEIEISSGKIAQKTFHSSNDANPSYDPDGNIYFNSERAYNQLEREPEILVLEKEFATPYRCLNSLGFEPVVSSDNNLIAFVKGNCRVSREQYRGPANRDIWIYNIETDEYFQVTSDEGQDVHPQWGKNNELYFMSSRSGKYNVYKVQVKSNMTFGEPVALTTYKDVGIRSFGISRNGKRLVVGRRDGLENVNIHSGRSSKIKLNLTFDFHFFPEEFETLNNDISEYSISPDEKYITIAARSEIFVIKNHKENPRAQRITNHSWKDEYPTWTSDSSLIFISDRTGSEEIFALKSAEDSNSDLYHSFRFDLQNVSNTEERETGIFPSPDLSKIAILQNNNTLLVYDIDSTGTWTNEREIVSGWATPGGISWSPDSRWLAYEMDNLYFNEDIFISDAEGKMEPVNVSMHPRGDSDPVWSRDGSKLGFRSNRNNGDDDIWFVWLKKEDWEKSKQDWDEQKYAPTPVNKKNKEKEKGEDNLAKDSIEIDFDNIYRRLVQVTSMPGTESNIVFGPEGEKIYFNGSGTGGSKFYSIKWDGTGLKTVLNSSIHTTQLSKDGQGIFYLSRGKMMKLNLKNNTSENIPFSASIRIDREAEKRQVFEELWRVLKDRFYDPEFHGQDWEELKDKYRPWVMKASTKQDFRTIVNEMLGQLNASHMGLYGGNPEETEDITTGRLGVEVKPKDSGIEVVHVVPGTSADRQESKLMEGDIILGINGHVLTNGDNFWMHLMAKSGERVWLKVQRGSAVKDIYIRPSSSINSDLYNEWVEERRRLTEKYSDGRLGYIHIQGMNWPSFEAFERELTASGYGKEGLVIDVRFNGGGWTTDMLMTVLSVKQHAYTIPRGATPSLKNHRAYREFYPFGERLPLSAWTLPAAAICNHSSYSNAEIFSHAFKTLGRGPLVGEPTFGAVISTGGQSLLDGSFIRLPFRAWYVKATDENMEGTPATPDYTIINPPGVKATGEDPQLKKAVEVLLGRN